MERRIRNEHIIGTTVMATSRLASSEKAMVSPMSAKRSRAMPWTNTMGKNTQIVVSVEANSAPETDFTPSPHARSSG